MMLVLTPNKFDLVDWFIPNLLDGLAGGAILTTPGVIALGVGHKHGSHASMLALSPNKFDPFDWFLPNLLDALT
jgi:hypothetical protein